MYPYVESLKVGAAYAALLYIWPSIVFQGILRNKGLTFRFIFCSIVQPLLLSTLALTLGLFHILNVWVVRLLFWGVLALSLLASFRRWRMQGGASARLPLRALITGSYGWKLFFFRVAEVPVRWWKNIWRDRREYVEYLVLAAVLLFGMAYFLNGAFHEYSFGCQELYTHFEWTSALLNGEIFPAGVYPEGMNCFLYALHTLFGVKLYSCVLFLAGIHNSSAFLLASYCLFKELFGSRHAPLFVLAAWLTFDGIGAAALQSMTRMTWMLPQEFALYLVFLCPLVLLRYFREDGRPGTWYRDENLLLWAAGIACAVSTSFNVLVMALVSCVAVSLVHYRQFQPAKRLLAPLSAMLYGIELGALPMLAACAMGKELEGSLLWWINSLRLKLHESSYIRLYGETAVVFVILALLLMSVTAAVHKNESRRRNPWETVLSAETVDGYLSLAAALAAFALLCVMPRMGLPELVSADRMRAVIRMLALGAAGILADWLILRSEHLRGWMLARRWMALGCLAVYLFANIAGFHQCTYWYLRRYNSAVTVTDQIMNRYPEWNYRIVSMWDEAYQVGWGSHEELITFLENTGKRNYSIPVEYIFLYVEKHPLQQGQKHFLTAPRWLARDNLEAYELSEDQSVCPNILHGELTDEQAQEDIHYYPNVLDNYEDLAVRSILSSKLYRWCLDFSKLHPAETNVYYEDDDFICFVIHQHPTAPLKLTSGGGSGI